MLYLLNTHHVSRALEKKKAQLLRRHYGITKAHQTLLCSMQRYLRLHREISRATFFV